MLSDPTVVSRMIAAIDPQAIRFRRRATYFPRPAADWQTGTPEGDFGRLLAEFDDDHEMKSLLVQLDESCRHETEGRPRALARRPVGNTPSPRRRTDRAVRYAGRRPAKRRRRRTTTRSTFANNRTRNISTITKGERSRLSVVRSYVVRGLPIRATSSNGPRTTKPPPTGITLLTDEQGPSPVIACGLAFPFQR